MKGKQNRQNVRKKEVSGDIIVEIKRETYKQKSKDKAKKDDTNEAQKEKEHRQRFNSRKLITFWNVCDTSFCLIKKKNEKRSNTNLDFSPISALPNLRGIWL